MTEKNVRDDWSGHAVDLEEVFELGLVGPNYNVVFLVIGGVIDEPQTGFGRLSRVPNLVIWL